MLKHLAFLALSTLLPLSAAAEWQAHVDHETGECAVSNGVGNNADLIIERPERRMGWSVEVVPGRIHFTDRVTFAESDATYDWAVTTLYEDGASSEWVRLPGGLLVMVDASGFQDAWNVCLAAQ